MLLVLVLVHLMMSITEVLHVGRIEQVLAELTHMIMLWVVLWIYNGGVLHRELPFVLLLLMSMLLLMLILMLIFIGFLHRILLI